MKEILGKAKSISELLGRAKYSAGHYHGQNLLARSRHPTCYENNPSFLKFIQETGLPFKAMDSFRTAKMEERSDFYLRRQPIKAPVEESSKYEDFFRLPPAVLHLYVEGDNSENCNNRLQPAPSPINSSKVRILLAGHPEMGLIERHKCDHRPPPRTPCHEPRHHPI